MAPITVARGDDLLVLNLRAPRAVRIETDVDPAAAKAMSMSSNYRLTAGQILIGLPERPGIYCAPIGSRGLTAAGPCLNDVDSDGRFETIMRAGFIGTDPQSMSITLKNKVMGIDFKDTQPLSAPVTYRSVDYREGPTALVRLCWQSKSKTDETMVKSTKIKLWLDASAKFTGTGIASEPVDFTFSGQPQLVQIAGMVLKILGVDANGALRFQVEKVEVERKVRFSFQNLQQTIFFFY